MTSDRAGAARLAAGTRVVMIVLDAMPDRHLDRARTPNLWRQAAAGTRAGGLSLPVSVTYANHAAFVTGAHPAATGVHGNHTWINGRGWVPSPDAGPRAATLFDRVAAAGGRSVLIAGDQHQVRQMGGEQADHVWPPGGRPPDGAGRCAHGYLLDAEVAAAAGRADLRADLVVLHLNEVDTVAHDHGPDSAAAFDQHRATDAAYGQLVGLLADGWERTVLITLSDHDQEPVIDERPVPLLDTVAALPGFDGVSEGTALLIHGPVEGRERAAIEAVGGVEGLEPLAPGIWMAWTVPGRVFSPSRPSLGGQHGSPRCRAQLAIVSGGHPRVGEIGRRLGGRRLSALSWAPLVTELLGLPSLPAPPRSAADIG